MESIFCISSMSSLKGLPPSSIFHPHQMNIVKEKSKTQFFMKKMPKEIAFVRKVSTILSLSNLIVFFSKMKEIGPHSRISLFHFRKINSMESRGKLGQGKASSYLQFWDKFLIKPDNCLFQDRLPM